MKNTYSEMLVYGYHNSAMLYWMPGFGYTKPMYWEEVDNANLGEMYTVTK